MTDIQAIKARCDAEIEFFQRVLEDTKDIPSRGCKQIFISNVGRKYIQKAIKALERYTEISRLTEENKRLNDLLELAKEDIKVGWTCRACAKRVVGKEWCGCPLVMFVTGPEKITMCDNFEWRGRKETK